MFLWVGLRATFGFAVVLQTVASLDDLSRKGPHPDKYTSPDGTTTSEATCSLPSLQPTTCLCDCNHRDCDRRQEALMTCGSVVFYGEQKTIKFSKDDTFYQARCKDQLDCLESIQCFLTCCVHGRGAEYMKRIIRSIEYEILILCYPHADPKYQQDFKDISDCANAIWPSVHQCVGDFYSNLSAAVTQDGVDIPRFCCSLNGLADCMHAASLIDRCDAKQQLYCKTITFKYYGEAYRLLCSDDGYTWDSPHCNCLPPIDNTGWPLTPSLGVHLAFARALTNSSNIL